MKLPLERLRYLAQQRARHPERVTWPALPKETPPMTITIRPFRPEDYDVVAAIRNRNLAEYPMTADELRFNDAHRDPQHRFARFVAELDGRVVGTALYGQYSDMYHPRKFWADVYVDPAHQRRGVGTALYRHVAERLEPWAPISVRTEVREDNAAGLAFAAQHGYSEERRSWESRIVPAAFDPAPFAAQRARVAASGVEIVTLAQLSADPDHRRKLYDLFVEVDADEPRPEAYTPWRYDYFVERVFDDPNLLPEAYFVALCDGQYVGQSTLSASQGSPELYTGLTGVKRAYRRRGIALALKLHALDYARAVGAPSVKTWNDSVNRPMLAINERLGFVRQPAWIYLIKVLREE